MKGEMCEKSLEGLMVRYSLFNASPRPSHPELIKVITSMRRSDALVMQSPTPDSKEGYQIMSKPFVHRVMHPLLGLVPRR